MRIGVPKEIKVLENRVGLTPASVHELVEHGHAVVVQHAAGQGIGMDDAAYRDAGATIAVSADEIFATADMIVKVKEPQAEERRLLRPVPGDHERHAQSPGLREYQFIPRHKARRSECKTA